VKKKPISFLQFPGGKATLSQLEREANNLYSEFTQLETAKDDKALSAKCERPIKKTV
jgi:hypothetical protein